MSVCTLCSWRVLTRCQIADFLSNVGQEEMSDMLDTIKEQMIPLIVDQMKAVDIPPINEEIGTQCSLITCHTVRNVGHTSLAGV